MKMIAALEPACADTCLCRERDRQAQTGDLPISSPPYLPAGRCSYRRGRWAGPSRLASPSLRIQEIPLDPPSPLLLASRSTSGFPMVVVPGSAVSAVMAPGAYGMIVLVA